MFELMKKTMNRLIPFSAIADSYPTESWEIINGSYQVSEQVIEGKIKVNGEAKLGKNTLIKEAMVINGNLKAFGVTFESELHINGTSTFTKCSLRGNSHFSGNLQATESHFLKDIILLTNQSTFSNCQINNVIVRSLPYVKAQAIYLSEGCVIDGNLTFEAGCGEVYLDSSSQIKGHIQGGKIISS